MPVPLMMARSEKVSQLSRRGPRQVCGDILRCFLGSDPVNGLDPLVPVCDIIQGGTRFSARRPRRKSRSENETRFIRPNSRWKKAEVGRAVARDAGGGPASWRGVSDTSHLRPEDGTTFRLMSGAMRQGVVCRVAGNPGGRRLWWFVDGCPAGETVGNAPFAVELGAGKHVLVCTTATGESAEVGVTLEGD